MKIVNAYSEQQRARNRALWDSALDTFQFRRLLEFLYGAKLLPSVKEGLKPALSSSSDAIKCISYGCWYKKKLLEVKEYDTRILPGTVFCLNFFRDTYKRMLGRIRPPEAKSQFTKSLDFYKKKNARVYMAFSTSLLRFDNKEIRMVRS